MFRMIRKWWHQHQRDIDLQILWPACKEQARNLDRAKAAFAYHVFHDPAWLELGDQLETTIDALE